MVAATGGYYIDHELTPRETFGRGELDGRYRVAIRHADRPGFVFRFQQLTDLVTLTLDRLNGRTPIHDDEGDDDAVD